MIALIYLGKSYLALKEFEKSLIAFRSAKKISPERDNLNKIIARLDSKLKVTEGSVERESDQLNLAYLAKKPLFNLETDQYVSRAVKKIFEKGSEAETLPSLSPLISREKAAKESLHSLFMSQGSTEKARNIDAAATPMDNEFHSYVKNLVSIKDESRPIDRILKRGDVLYKPLDIRSVLEFTTGLINIM